MADNVHGRERRGSSSKKSGIDKCVEPARKKLKRKSGEKSIVVLTDNGRFKVRQAINEQETPFVAF